MARHLTDNPVARSADRSPPNNPDPHIEEAKSTGTDGRILPFPVRVTSPSEPVAESVPPPVTLPTQNQPFTHGLLGLVTGRTWRAKLRTKNREYPEVTSPGTYFISHSGGFQLYAQKTRDYLGHYTKAAIAALEEKYGRKKKSRQRHFSDK
jgi:hypothetical protein